MLQFGGVEKGTYTSLLEHIFHGKDAKFYFFVKAE